MVLAPSAPDFNWAMKVPCSEKIELVGIQRFFYCIDDYVHFVVGVEFGNLVAGTDTSTIALLQITRAIG